MKTSIQQHKITQSWSSDEMQLAARKTVSHQIASRILFLEKHHGKEIADMEKASAHLSAEMLQKSGIATPYELVQYLADYEVNMMGSEINVSGDNSCAVLTNEKSTVWLETIQTYNFSDEQSKEMHEEYTAWMKHLGHKFDFKVHVHIEESGVGSSVTFTKK